MNGELATIVAQFLDIQSLGRFARTSKEIREAVENNELAWQAVFERITGNRAEDVTKTPAEWTRKSWRERVRMLTTAKEPFEKMEHGIVFSFGSWRILRGVLEEGIEQVCSNCFIMTEDMSIVVEVVWTAQSWFRFRLDGQSFVVWPWIERQFQSINSKSLTEALGGKELSAFKAIPVFAGLSTKGPPDVLSNISVDLTQDAILVHIRHDLLITLMRDDARASRYNRCKLTELPLH